MAAQKLFSFKSRDESHKKLEELLGQTREGEGLKYGAPKEPTAECREVANDQEPYQVWDGPAEPNTREPEPACPPVTPGDLDRLADLVVKKLLEKGAKP